jgi:hypothetical protein
LFDLIAGQLRKKLHHILCGGPAIFEEQRILNLFPLLQAAVTITLNGRIVDEDIRISVTSYESITFSVVKPLDHACYAPVHTNDPPKYVVNECCFCQAICVQVSVVK